MQPRLYSIASSPKADAGRVALTVDAVRYAINKRRRLGVASTFFAERVAPGAPLKLYVQTAHGFALPPDPATAIIMVGPGTGVAPFRAFLRERQATRAPGRNWLFFGHQREDTDFFYKDELTAMKETGFLNRLTLAWSREGNEKIYVQDRMREVGAELWRWLAEGAHFYVCGDAKRMAKDVERALVDVVGGAWRPFDRRGHRLRQGIAEGRPLSGGRLLSDERPRRRTARRRGPHHMPVLRRRLRRDRPPRRARRRRDRGRPRASRRTSAGCARRGPRSARRSGSTAGSCTR